MCVLALFVVPALVIFELSSARAHSSSPGDDPAASRTPRPVHQDCFDDCSLDGWTVDTLVTWVTGSFAHGKAAEGAGWAAFVRGGVNNGREELRRCTDRSHSSGKAGLYFHGSRPGLDSAQPTALYDCTQFTDLGPVPATAKSWGRLETMCTGRKLGAG